MSPTSSSVRHAPVNLAFGRIGLAALFLAFCYALLSWRALMFDGLAPLFSQRRLIALMVGAGLFWLALKRLDTRQRVTLARMASWIVGATIIVLVARMSVDQLWPAQSLTLGYEVRWSLAWGAYFGLWVMGAMAFRRRQVAAATTDDSRLAVSAAIADDIDWLVDAISPEFAGADRATRQRIAERLLGNAASYELADEHALWTEHNRRARLAQRVAARLIA